MSALLIADRFAELFGAGRTPNVRRDDLPDTPASSSDELLAAAGFTPLRRGCWRHPMLGDFLIRVETNGQYVLAHRDFDGFGSDERHSTYTNAVSAMLAKAAL